MPRLEPLEPVFITFHYPLPHSTSADSGQQIFASLERRSVQYQCITEILPGILGSRALFLSPVNNRSAAAKTCIVGHESLVQGRLLANRPWHIAELVETGVHAMHVAKRARNTQCTS